MEPPENDRAILVTNFSTGLDEAVESQDGLGRKIVLGRHRRDLGKAAARPRHRDQGGHRPSGVAASPTRWRHPVANLHRALVFSGANIAAKTHYLAVGDHHPRSRMAITAERVMNRPDDDQGFRPVDATRRKAQVGAAGLAAKHPKKVGVADINESDPGVVHELCPITRRPRARDLPHGGR